MLYYEWKKTFTTKRIIILGVILAIVSVWVIYESKILVSIEDLPNPFVQFIGCVDYLNILIWLILIIIAPTVFTKELDLGMAPILQTSRYGRKQIAKTKLTLTLLFANTMYILSILVMLLSYHFAWDMDFGIPITEGYELELAANPGIRTFGDVILIQTLGLFYQINFLALFCLFLSQKLRNGFSTAVIMLVANFGFAVLPKFNVPVLDQIIDLTPFCFTGRAGTYKVLLYLGSFAVSPVHIGFVVYTILIILLLRFLVNSPLPAVGC